MVVLNSIRFFFSDEILFGLEMILLFTFRITRNEKKMFIEKYGFCLIAFNLIELSSTDFHADDYFFNLLPCTGNE